MGLANSGDVVIVGTDCAQTFIEYLLHITGVSDVLTLSHRADCDLDAYLSSESVFSGLPCDPLWESARQRQPVLSPYMQSAAVYIAARKAGITVDKSDWKLAVEDRLIERMNDKALFYKECKKLRIPVPEHWTVTTDEVARATIDLLKSGCGPLYIRPTRSGGTVGNITVDRVDSTYALYERGIRTKSESDFTKEIRQIVNSGFWSEYLIAKLMQLVASPGTLFFANDKRVDVISHTYQILDTNRFFLGFVYPIKDKSMQRHCCAIEKFIQQLIEPYRTQGYRGFGNIDWMVTKDGELVVAERNARQTAVVVPLMIANKLSRANSKESTMVAPNLTILTRDALEIEEPASFEEIYAILHKANVLYEQNRRNEGVIITMPPLPRYGINTVSFIVIGHSASSTHRYYIRTLHALGHELEDLLFKHPIDS